MKKFTPTWFLAVFAALVPTANVSAALLAETKEITNESKPQPQIQIVFNNYSDHTTSSAVIHSVGIGGTDDWPVVAGIDELIKDISELRTKS